MRCSIGNAMTPADITKIEDIDAALTFVRKIATTHKSNIWLCRSRLEMESPLLIVKELFLSEVSKAQQLVDHVWNERCVLTLLTSLQFPQTSRLLATSKNADALFFVMDLIDGAPLHLHVPKCGLDMQSATAYFWQVTQIIRFLHSQRIVYRDLKLSNLILRRADGRISICDFGHAKVMTGERTNSICGTPHAMAPEVIRGDSYGLGCDFWGLGILLFELIEGHPPFGHSWEEGKAIPFGPKHTAASRDLISQLLEPDATRRLVDMSRVQSHTLFAGQDDWDRVTPDFDVTISERFIHGIESENDIFADF